MTPKRGRPARTSEASTTMLAFRVTADEAARIRGAALAAHASVAAWTRQAVLDCLTAAEATHPTNDHHPTTPHRSQA